jgi:peptidyl-prolyl cis-trans isomerase A (cyclophilin A)
VNTATKALFAVAITGIAFAGCQKSAGPSPLLTPSAEALAKPAPDSFRVAFLTNKGRFVVRAVRAWAPNGVDRFYYLVNNGYFDDVKFFRVLPNFMAQFGVHGDPAVNAVWENRSIPDDPVRESNQRGSLSFATSGPNTRTVQLFINKRDNRRLDAMGFAPIGRVTEGMAVVDSLYMGYGEGPPGGLGPDQSRIGSEGNRYLNRNFPKLDSIVNARILKD